MFSQMTQDVKILRFTDTGKPTHKGENHGFVYPACKFLQLS